MDLARLFVGLQFSESFLQQLEPWTKKIRKTADKKEVELKWIPPENLHVTLVFLGPTEKSRISDLEQKLQAVASGKNCFSLKVRGLSGFPEPRHARVLYLGIQRSQALLDLQSDLENQLIDPSSRELDYVPHLTLARLRNPRSCVDLLSPFENVDFGKQEVREIVLFRSFLAGSYPVYEKIATASLRDREDSV